MTSTPRQHKVNDYLTWQDGSRLRRGRVVGWCDDRRVYIVEDPTWTPRQPGCGWVLVPYEDAEKINAQEGSIQ